jgi:hypothetical protein
METLAATNNLFPTLSFAEEKNALYQGTAKKSIPVEEYATAYKAQEDKFIANKRETDKMSTMLANFSALKGNEPHLLEATNKAKAQLEDLKNRGNYEDAEIEISGIVRDYSSDQMLQGVLGNVTKNEEYIKSLEAAKIPHADQQKLVANAQKNVGNDHVDKVTGKYVSHYNPYKVPATPFDAIAVVETVIKDYAFDQGVEGYVSYNQGPPDPLTGEATFVIHGKNTIKTIRASEVAESIKLALDNNGGYQEHLNYRAHVDTMDVDFSKEDVASNFITKDDPKGENGYQKMFDLYKNANPTATDQEINNAIAKEYHKANITTELMQYGSKKADYVQQSLEQNVLQDSARVGKVLAAAKGETASVETVTDIVAHVNTAPKTVEQAEKNVANVDAKAIKTATAVSAYVTNLNKDLKGKPAYKVEDVTYDSEGYPVINVTQDGENINIGDNPILYRLQLEARENHEEKLKKDNYVKDIFKKAGITIDFAGLAKLVETDVLGATEQQRMQAFLYFKQKGDDKSAALVMTASEGLFRKGLGPLVEDGVKAWNGLSGVAKGRAIHNNKLSLVSNTSNVEKEKLDKAAKEMSESNIAKVESKTITNPKAVAVAQGFIRASLPSTQVRTLDGVEVNTVPAIIKQTDIIPLSENENTMQFHIVNENSTDDIVYTIPVSPERQEGFYIKHRTGSPKGNIMINNQVQKILNGETISGFVGDPADNIKVTLANPYTEGISGNSGVPRFLVNVNGMGDNLIGNLEDLEKYVNALYTKEPVK